MGSFRSHDTTARRMSCGAMPFPFHLSDEVRQPGNFLQVDFHAERGKFHQQRLRVRIVETGFQQKGPVFALARFRHFHSIPTLASRRRSFRRRRHQMPVIVEDSGFCRYRQFFPFLAIPSRQPACIEERINLSITADFSRLALAFDTPNLRPCEESRVSPSSPHS